MKPVIIVHGGAKDISADKVAANQAGCLAAVEAGWNVLHRGGSAAAAVEAAICVLESDQTFNAGFGSTMNSAGEVEADAAMMAGATLAWGAVAAVQGVRHPISAARKIMEDKPRFLVAKSGERFALEHGLEMCAKEDLVSQEQYQEWKAEVEVLDRPNTVGCVALDVNGNLVAGTSTGGTTGQPQGRVGDTALVGCGLYADNRLGACSTTGDGESIIPVVLAKTAIDGLAGGSHPDQAAQRAIDTLVARVEGEAGCILLDRQGRMGWAYNSSDMAVAYMAEDLPEPVAFTGKNRPAAIA
ncbi:MULTISPECIES: isoaspartyl peptidase/L-asparaginase family protein [Cyanophyceae]|uniref:isoaspartyl peptidase/L-asparaginase family protein n=1 Tax=Cyanophyceae TaxID=3028117 RepID=UPI001686737D|nr:MULTISPECIES: isoaspartyl peptidase/L-asparaginase family protein [Cyanophyceae]MBD1916696.1 isoaspartyl peptidase/L-asparaginase [Phormidium sp. FACHB-77]MBD2031766.1 isoaspartyl peptidase/L-asparaginase [Phormidium sp. FACHB-322]MBD2050516.1 isoaspartyl peptidase/L-asparaginase [Leptolyngbya sp. FACHB-60]